jgi:hypothetical protein
MSEAPSRPYRKVFIVGCPRSGTTWTRRVLLTQPSVVSGAESHVYPQLYQPLASRGIEEGAAEALARWDDSRAGALGDGHAGPHHWVEREVLERLISQAAQQPVDSHEAAEGVVEGIFDSYFSSHGGTSDHVLVEKTPGHLYFTEKILQRWPEARVVEVLRDGRDVCVSLQHKAKAAEWAPADRTKQIQQWTTAVRHGMKMRAKPIARGRWHVVRYEAMAADPVGETRRLFDFVGIECGAEEIDRAVESASFARLPPTRVGETDHFRKGVAGDWVNHFDRDDIRLFETLAGDVFEEAGYAW